MNTNYGNSGKSKGKIITPVTLLAVAVGGLIFWLSKRSSKDTSSDSPGLKEKAKDANEQIDKEELKGRFQRIVELVKTTAESLQNIYEKQGKEIIEESQQIKEQAENVASTAKEAGEELKEVRDTTGQEAKEELEGAKDAAKVETSSSESNEEEAPFDQTVSPFRDPRNQ